MTELIPPTSQKSYAYRALDGITTAVTEAYPIFGQTFTYQQYYDQNNLCGARLLDDWLYDQLNSGKHTFIYEGHGGWNALGAEEGCGRYIFKLNDCIYPYDNIVYNKLFNDFYSFMIFNCCSAGQFDYPSGDCIAEVVVNMSQRGAIGVLASSRDSNTGGFGVVDKRVLDAMYNNLSHIMGEAVLESKLNQYSMYRRQYNLYGDPAVNLWPLGYNVSENLVLSGTVQVANSITVPSGVTLTIQPGATLVFSNNASLNIYGTLTAVGTSSNKIKLIRSSSTGTWNGITFDGASTSGSVLDNVEISYATEIKCLNGADVTIQNSLIDHCTNGIYIYNSAPAIIANEILEPHYNGIYGQANSKSPLIKNNTIIKNSTRSQQGIYLQNNTNPYITGNDIQGFAYGLYYGGGGSGIFTDSDLSTPAKNNRFKNNTIGMTVAWGSYLNAGIPSPAVAYNNSIYDNTSYDATAYQNSYLLAFRNWWGSDGPQLYSYSGGTISASLHLGTDPWEAISKPVSDSEILAASSEPVSEDYLYTALNLEKTGNIQDAVNFYKSMIDKKIHREFALSRLTGILKKTDKTEIKDYLEELASKDLEFRPHVLNLLAGIYVDENNFSEAVNLWDQIIKTETESYCSINARYQKFYAALHLAKDIILAEKLLSEIEQLNLKDEEFNLMLDAAKPQLNSLQNSFEQEKSGSFNSVVLNQNYPNPFNPQTTINFNINRKSFVQFKIFDILGREVAELINGTREIGTYSIDFDASTLPSGIYIYSLRVNDYFTSKKMILLK